MTSWISLVSVFIHIKTFSAFLAQWRFSDALKYFDSNKSAINLSSEEFEAVLALVLEIKLGWKLISSFNSYFSKSVRREAHYCLWSTLANSGCGWWVERWIMFSLYTGSSVTSSIENMPWKCRDESLENKMFYSGS